MTLSWMVVVSMKSKPPPLELIEAAVVIDVPKVIASAVPLLKVSKALVSTPSSSKVLVVTPATRTTRSLGWCMPETDRDT